MYKAKHSKFRNAGLLFELLARQVTADILAGKDESSAKNLLFKYSLLIYLLFPRFYSK